MLKDILARVEKRLQVTDQSATAASKAAGLGEDGIRNMRRAVDEKTDRSGVSTTTLTRLAPILQTTAGWLLDGSGSEEGRSVRLVGYVGAGAEAHYYASADEQFEYVPAPEGSTDDTVAVEVRGESLGPLFEHWLVYYDEVRRPASDDLIGRLCVVGLVSGKVLVKKLQRSRAGKHFYHLLSNNEAPLLDQEVEWAARVRLMTPR